MRVSIVDFPRQTYKLEEILNPFTRLSPGGLPSSGDPSSTRVTGFFFPSLPRRLCPAPLLSRCRRRLRLQPSQLLLRSCTAASGPGPRASASLLLHPP